MLTAQMIFRKLTHGLPYSSSSRVKGPLLRAEMFFKLRKGAT